jgi:hypothetical protein
MTPGQTSWGLCVAPQGSSVFTKVPAFNLKPSPLVCGPAKSTLPPSVDAAGYVLPLFTILGPMVQQGSPESTAQGLDALEQSFRAANNLDESTSLVFRLTGMSAVDGAAAMLILRGTEAASTGSPLSLLTGALTAELIQGNPVELGLWKAIYQADDLCLPNYVSAFRGSQYWSTDASGAASVFTLIRVGYRPDPGKIALKLAKAATAEAPAAAARALDGEKAADGGEAADTVAADDDQYAGYSESA